MGSIKWHFRTETDACGISFSNKKIYSTGDDGYLRCINAGSGDELWHIKRSGELYAQPLILDNMVIIGDETGSIIAADKLNGKIIWEKQVANSNIRSALSSDGEYIYAAFLEGKIACLDTKGNVIWTQQCEFYDLFGEDFKDIYAAPTLVDSLVVITFSRSVLST